MVTQIRYIDLFAGCGGISLGFYHAGLKGIFAVEKSLDAFTTLKYNLIDTHSHFEWPEWLQAENWNIYNLLQKKPDELLTLRGVVDLVVGGPPCQGFSLVGQRRESDKRNTLIHAYLDFIEVVQPRAVMFENVRGFTVKFNGTENQNKTAYSEILLQKLDSLGYHDAQGKMIDFSDYGVPQRRQRFIVIASRESVTKNIFAHLEQNREKFLSARCLQVRNSTHTALSDLERKHGITECPDSKRFLSGIVALPQNNFQKYLRLSEQDRYVPDSHRFVNHTPEIIDVFSDLIEKVPRNKRICGEERTKYNVKKRNVTVLDPEKSALTLTTIPDDFVHYSEPRVMTVRECARLQTFPDWFEFKGPYTTGGKRRVKQVPRYTQVGNAVPPLFAEQLGIAIKKGLADD